MPATILVTSLLDSGRGTLRAAIEKANLVPNNRESRAHADTIEFAALGEGDDSSNEWATGPCHRYVDIRPRVLGSRLARSGAAQTPPFGVLSVKSGAVVEVTGLTITGGFAASGGGIANAGSLSLVNTAIIGNEAFG